MSQLAINVWAAAIRDHESHVIRLVEQGRLFDAARFDSPEAIGRAYAAALDVLAPSIGHEPNFQAQGRELISFINSWLRDVDGIYADYLSISKNVGGVDREDLVRAIDIAINGITVAGVLMELIQIAATGLLSGDIEKVARYRAVVEDFKARAETHIGIHIVGRRG